MRNNKDISYLRDVSSDQNETYACVEFTWTSSYKSSEFCDTLNEARYGHLAGNDIVSLPNQIKGCTRKYNRTLCYCNRKLYNCTGSKWIEELMTETTQCPNWSSSYIYHNSGSDYWIKFVNADLMRSLDTVPPNGCYELKKVSDEILRESYDSFIFDHHASVTEIYSSQKQEIIYGSSTEILMLVWISSLIYLFIIMVLCMLLSNDKLWQNNKAHQHYFCCFIVYIYCLRSGLTNALLKLVNKLSTVIIF
ncbi:hypothetical protein DICVIV_02087 [Dictyocaulus viviparus]|uniref:Uncharacterized protein n=1 Tax=Dictyocaulus viviparus TaxID=29172 RepID=A0A0D8Y4Y8_DICVI|nr:hypothetical protein DICVIV_02087 [Dictyocaulus viviparus]